ncbi:MAG: alpha/beta hydrolase [bacterium]|nr:alpha/beta hydrolase [bacterium]
MRNIILLHGALGSASDLENLELVLNGLNFEVHQLTFSGHGSVPFQKEFGINQFVNELEDYVLSHKLRNCSAFGYSMGGYVALVLAAKNRGLLGKIITLGTKFNWTADNIEREKSACHSPTLLLKQPAFAESLRLAHGDWEQLVEKTSDMIGCFLRENFLNPQALEQISIPVLLCLGENDKMVTREETEAVWQKLPNSDYLLIPEAKHQLQTTNMQVLGSAIQNFVFST